MQTLDFQKMENIERSATRRRTFYRWLLFIILGIFALYYLAPLYVMIITSLKTMEEIRQGNLMTFPREIIFDSWKTAWSGRGGIDAGNVFLRPFFWNSLKMVVPAVVISTFFGALNGYALTKCVLEATTSCSYCSSSVVLFPIRQSCFRWLEP